MFLALLILLFIVVPVVELWFIIMLADWLGGGPAGAALVIVLLLIDSLIGAMLLRSQGLAVWGRFLQAVRERRIPHREVIDGVFVAVGGALLLTPGFITDFVGLAMLLPPTRKGMTGFVNRRVSKRVMRTVGVEGFEWQSRPSAGGRGTQAPPPRPPVDDDVVDVEAVEEEIEFRFDNKRLEGH